MFYSVIRRRGTEETAIREEEAIAAVRLLRDWSRSFPQQDLAVQDDRGVLVAFRHPRNPAQAEL